MTQHPMQWLIQKLAERFVALFGRLFASRVETMVLLQEMADQEAIEQQVKELESAGLPQLAEQLRSRALALSSDNPASLALPAVRNIAQDDFSSLPAALTPNASDTTPTSTSRRLSAKSGK